MVVEAELLTVDGSTEVALPCVPAKLLFPGSSPAVLGNWAASDGAAPTGTPENTAGWKPVAPRRADGLCMGDGVRANASSSKSVPPPSSSLQLCRV